MPFHNRLSTNLLDVYEIFVVAVFIILDLGSGSTGAEKYCGAICLQN